MHGLNSSITMMIPAQAPELQFELAATESEHRDGPGPGTVTVPGGRAARSPATVTQARARAQARTAGGCDRGPGAVIMKPVTAGRQRPAAAAATYWHGHSGCRAAQSPGPGTQ
jgi:hypothetical protein